MALFGLRARESLEFIPSENCATCGSQGEVKKTETLGHAIFREIIRDSRACENDSLMVLASQAVVDRLLGEEAALMAILREILGKTLSMRAEPSYSPEHFDIILL